MNTLGAIVGVIVAVHLLLRCWACKGALLVGAAIDVVLGVVLLGAAAPRGAARARCASPSPAIAALWRWSRSASPSTSTRARSASGVFRSGSRALGADDEVLYHRDGKTATVDVVEYDAALRADPHQRQARRGDQHRTPARRRGDEYTMALLALLPLGHAPDAQNAAVIGFGSGMSTATLLGSPHARARRHDRDRARDGRGRAALPAARRAPPTTIRAAAS